MIPAIVDALRAYRSPALHGWVIARLSVTEEAGNAGLVQTNRKAVITARLPAAGAWLRVTLVPGRESPVPQPTGDTGGTLVVSPQHLEKYLLVSGDDNPVHQGARAILPALLLLQEIFECCVAPARFEVRFMAPAVVNQGIFLSEEGPHVTASNAAGEALLRISRR